MSEPTPAERLFAQAAKLEHHLDDAPPYMGWREDLRALRDAALASTRKEATDA